VTDLPPPGRPREDEAARRLHPVAALLSMSRSLRNFVPLVLIAVITRPSELSVLFGFGAIAIAFSLIEGVGSWLRFRYRVVQAELRVEQGFLVRRRAFIPIDRIQAIDVSAGLIERLFGVVRIEIKTAAEGTQAELSAVTEAEARRLQELLQTRRDQQDQPTERTPRYALTLRDLILGASTSGRLTIILSGFGWLYSRAEEVIDRWLLERLELIGQTPTAISASPAWIAFGVFLLLVVSWLVSFTTELVRYGGFGVQRQNGELRITRGLLERRSITIPVRHIQAIRIVEGLLRQPLGYAAVLVESAGHAEEKGQSTHLHPFVHKDRIVELLSELCPEHDLTALRALPTNPPSGAAPIGGGGARVMRPPPRALRRFLMAPVVLTLLATGVAATLLPNGWLVGALLFPVAWIGQRAHRETAVALGDHLAALRFRSLQRTTVLLQRRRVQSVTLSRSLLQRRLGLSTIELSAASGSGRRRFSVTELDAADALATLEWCAPSARSSSPPTSPAESPAADLHQA